MSQRTEEVAEEEEPLGFKTLHYLGGMEVLLRIRGEKRRVAAFIL